MTMYDLFFFYFIIFNNDFLNLKIKKYIFLSEYRSFRINFILIYNNKCYINS